MNVSASSNRRAAALLALVAAGLIFVSSCAVLNINTIRKDFFANHPNVSPGVRSAINEGRLLIGMEEAEVVAAIGYPVDINRSTSQYGTTCQFCYRTYSYYELKPPYSYVYFENGRVTSWQQ